MITSNIPSPSGSTQTTATSHNQFPSLSNQPSSRYPILPNSLPYNPFPPYFMPVQQPVLPPSYPQAYLSSYPYTLRQGNELTHAHAPSDFTSPPAPNPVHLNQQYCVLPSHTNTANVHQNPFLSYEQHLPPLDGPPPPQRPRLDSSHLTSFSPTSTAVAHHSLAPPTPITTVLSPQLLNSIATSQRDSYTFPQEDTLHQCTSHVPLSQHPTPSCTPLTLPTSTSQVTSYIPSPAIEHCLQQQTSHSTLSPHPTPSYTPSPLPTTAVHSPAPPSPSATTPSAVTTGSSSAPAHQHFLSPYLQQYVQHLKNRYISIDTPVYDKEHGLLQAKVKSFINIALVHKDSPKYMIDSDKNEMLMNRLHGHVDAIQKKKTKLRMCDVCKSQVGRLARCVLVEGAPGVGKTTFAFEVCKQWTRGEILQEWAVVVIIKLRDQRARTAQNMYDLLYHPRPEVKQAVVDDLIDQDGKGMLLILDGYDELTDNQKESTSVIQQIMGRDLLVQATLMVTSRPLATRTLHDNFLQSIDQHIEVLGFTEKNIEEYIQSACRDKPELVEDFKSYLSCHPFSSALMFNPLQCAIVTDLYRSHWECGDKGFAPNTLTELYTGLGHILLLRHLKLHPVYKKIQKIKNLNDLPEEVSQQLKSVTKLAAEGIENKQYVFDKDEGKVPIETLGLMQAEEEVISGTGTSESYNFLHLTLQEYLAAVNYSQQCSSPEQLSELLTQDNFFPLDEFFENYGKKRKHASSPSSATHWPVVLFVAGRTKLDGISPNILMAGIGHNVLEEERLRQEHWHRKSHYCLTEYSEVNVSLLHLLYETQSPQLIQSTLVTSRKYLSASGSSALDWFVIGYCIANSTSTWRVEKKGNDSPKYFDQLVMGLCLGPEECSGERKIGSLHISGHWNKNWMILSNLQPYAKSVTEIKLVANKQREQHDPEKSRSKSASEEVSASYPMLESLSINNIKSNYSSSLLSFISQHSNLHILSLNQCHLSSFATSSLIHFLQSSNKTLHKLTLDDCTIQIPDHNDSVAISYQRISISPSDTGIFSLTIAGSLYAINYILSQPDLFCKNTLTSLKVTIVSGTGDSLQIDKSYFSNLNMLNITSKEENHTLLHDSVLYIISQRNTLCILSLKRCKLTCDTVRSLIHSLQSSHLGLQELTLDDCISDHTHTTTTLSKLKLKSLECGNVSLEFTGDYCDVSHWLSQLSSYTQLTELILYLKRQDSDTLQKLLLYHHLLESLKIHSIFHNSHASISLPLSIPQFIELQQNNLYNLSVRRCILSSDVTRSLTNSLQSLHCRLHKLTIDECKISTPDETHGQQNTISTKNNTTLCSLVTTDSLCVLNHILSNVLFTQMTELSLCITTHNSSEAEMLAKIPCSCPVLETIKIDSSVILSLPISIPQFIELQQNNLHTLSLRRCTLCSDVTRSLIHSLQSPHCRLHKLTMDECAISTTDETEQNTISTKNNTTLCSLVTTDSLCVLNHILSNVIFTQMTELSLCITTQNSSKAEVLSKIPISCPVLETIKIGSFVSLTLPLSIHHFTKLQQNNLCTLSLSECNLSNDVTRSLIYFLQSPQCKLLKLALKECTISVPEDTEQTTTLTKTNVALHSLDISWSVLDEMMSCINPVSQSLTELILYVDSDINISGLKTMLQEIPSNCPLLETLKIDNDVNTFLSLSIPQVIGSQQNNLHTLSLHGCNLSSDVTCSLIQSMQSLHSMHIQNLALKECTISLPEDTQQTTIFKKMNVALHSLDISWSVLNQMMSCINPFTPSLTELILHFDSLTHTCTSGVETILQEIPSKCPLLQTLKIGSYCRIPFRVSISQFIGSQPNNFHTLSLRNCMLSSDVTRSLVHFLQSLHCRMCKLALYDCTIPTTDHTQLTTAIVSSTTITHLLFDGRKIDTPSLTALASGLKHNTTIEQLAINKYVPKDRFKLLIDAVDSSAVKKLWLCDQSDYKRWFSNCPLSKKNIDIEWYSDDDDLYNKW